MAPCIVHGLLGCFFITSAQVGLVFLTPVFEKFPTGFHYFTAGCASDIMECVCNPVSQRLSVEKKHTLQQPTLLQTQLCQTAVFIWCKLEQ